MNRFYVKDDRLLVVTPEGKQCPFSLDSSKITDFTIDEDMSCYERIHVDLTLYTEEIHPATLPERQRLIAFHENALKELQRND